MMPARTPSGEAAGDAGTPPHAHGQPRLRGRRQCRPAELVAACAGTPSPRGAGTRGAEARFLAFDFPPGTLGVSRKKGGAPCHQGLCHVPAACSQARRLSPGPGASQRHQEDGAWGTPAHSGVPLAPLQGLSQWRPAGARSGAPSACSPAAPGCAVVRAAAALTCRCSRCKCTWPTGLWGAVEGVL